MTKQEIFDQVVAMLAARNFARAGIYDDIRDKFYCKYRSEIGPCALGFFITDEEYDVSMEGKIGDLVVTEYHIAAFQNISIGFLARLQEAHDTGATPEEMKRNFGGLAMRESLEIPEVLND